MKFNLALCLREEQLILFYLENDAIKHHAKGKKLYVYCGARESF